MRGTASGSLFLYQHPAAVSGAESELYGDDEPGGVLLSGGNRGHGGIHPRGFIQIRHGAERRAALYDGRAFRLPALPAGHLHGKQNQRI